MIPSWTWARVVINEIQASNKLTIADKDGDYEDWIELYNPSDTETFDLSYYGLSDDSEQPFRWVIPEGIFLAPGEFILIWASGKDQNNPDGELHTSFSIAQGGEEILLTHPLESGGENRRDEVQPIPIPSDNSYGRIADGDGDWAYFDQPTPGASNSTATPAYDAVLEPPVASISGGFHPEPFTLTLEVEQAGVEIRYTLDGSEPTSDSPLYTGSIFIDDRSDESNDLSDIEDISFHDAPIRSSEPVSKGTVIRAKAFREGAKPSRVLTETYFVDEERHERNSFPVVNISTDRDHLFGYEEGIYVLGKIWEDNGRPTSNNGAPANYRQRGEEWERPAHFTFFETDGTKALSQDIGIRIHGGYSRAYPQKSLRLYSRSEYGESRFRYRMFPDLELDNFNRLILRQSGQDVIQTMFKDAFIQESVKHMRFDIQHFRPVVVFFNGEYWGIYNIRQRYDRFYLETHYGLDEDEIDLLTGGGNENQTKEGNNDDYLDLRRYVDEEEMSRDHLYETAIDQIDKDNLLDYFIANIFIANTDWPRNNIDFWRKHPGNYDPNNDLPEHDGRWRWMLFDTDAGFAMWREKNYNSIVHTTELPGRNHYENLLFGGLIDNRGFRDEFYNRFADMLNTTFRSERMVALIDSFQTIYAPEIEEHIRRRDTPETGNYPSNISEWNGHIEDLREFAEVRPNYQWQHLMHFDNKDLTKLTFNVSDPEHGYITVNSVDIHPSTVGVGNNPWPWQGYYFQGITLPLSANPNPGYEFVGWKTINSKSRSGKTTSGSRTMNESNEDTTTLSTEETFDLTPSGPINIVAEFRKSTDVDISRENVPQAFSLYQNYPNPFNSHTNLRFALPHTEHVQIDIFDITGRHVLCLVDETRSAGWHHFNFDASNRTDMASGLYLYRIQAGPFTETNKMLLIK